MKEKVFSYIQSHPSCRLREIGSALGMWHPHLLPYIYELEKEGKITSQRRQDVANMEYWIEYSIA